jgi:hypothetical protein
LSLNHKYIGRAEIGAGPRESPKIGPNPMRKIEGSLAVIVCQHNVQDGVQICRGSRSEQIVPEDSGWQFCCGKCNAEDESKASVWSVNELLDFDSSLKSWINSDIGTTIIKHPGETNWQKLHS